MFRLLMLLICATVAWPAMADALDKLVTEAKSPARFAAHKPAFTVARETFTFTPNGKEEKTEFHVIRDAGKVVAVLHPGMNQLDMTTFDPTRTPAKPPFADYYSWGKLLGVRITTAAWYPDMSASGSVVTTFSPGGETLTLTTVQTWNKPDRKGSSTYVMTLRCDATLGYVWDIKTDMELDNPILDAKGAKVIPEFFNWQVKVTEMGRVNNQPWPVKWDHERTVFWRTDDKIVGFWMNPQANDRSKFKKVEVKEGGFVAKLPGPNGWGVALVHAEKSPTVSFRNNTCNMWADSHNYLKFPEVPNRMGMYRITAKWRFTAVPPEVVKVLIDRAEMDTLGHEAK